MVESYGLQKMQYSISWYGIKIIININGMFHKQDFRTFCHVFYYHNYIYIEVGREWS